MFTRSSIIITTTITTVIYLPYPRDWESRLLFACPRVTSHQLPWLGKAWAVQSIESWRLSLVPTVGTMDARLLGPESRDSIALRPTHPPWDLDRQQATSEILTRMLTPLLLIQPLPRTVPHLHLLPAPRPRPAQAASPPPPTSNAATQWDQETPRRSPPRTQKQSPRLPQT